MKRISIILSTLNEESNITAFLDSIIKQDYPHQDMEILIAEGGSQDHTRQLIQEKADATDIKIDIYDNSKKKIAEFGEAICLGHATGEIVLILAADERLVQSDLISQMVKPFDEDIPELLGVRSYSLDSGDMPAASAYLTSCLHIFDPIANFVCKKPRVIQHKDGWDLCHISEPYTCGANGFFFSMKTLRKIGWFEQFNESLIAHKGLRMGFNKLAVKKGYGIYHYYTPSLRAFLKKKMKLGLKHMTRASKEPATDWLQGKNGILFLGALYFLSVIPPLLASIVYALRDRKWKWLLHMPVGFATTCIYIYSFVTFKIFKRYQW